MTDPNIFIDALKIKLNLRQDAMLAARIKVEATRISKIRCYERPISAKFLLIVHENTGIPLAELKEMMRAPRVKAKAVPVVPEEVVSMDDSNIRQRYDMDFKLNAVRMVSDAMPGMQVAKQLNVAYTTLHNWITADRAGRLRKSVELSTEEIDYLRRILKERAVGLRQQTGSDAAKQEKNLIAALRKILSKPASNAIEKFPFPGD